MRKSLFSILIFISFSSFISTLAAQEEWKEIQMENPGTQEPMDFLKAIGIPAQAVYGGKKLKAYVFIWGREKKYGNRLPNDVGVCRCY
jgi:hypothetical protein